LQLYVHLPASLTPHDVVFPVSAQQPLDPSS